MAIIKFDWTKSQFRWLKPTYYSVTIVVIIWIIFASIHIIPVSLYVLQGSYKSRELFVQHSSFINVALKGVEWNEPNILNSHNVTIHYEVNILVFCIIGLFWIPLYLFVSLIINIRTMSLETENKKEDQIVITILGFFVSGIGLVLPWIDIPNISYIWFESGYHVQGIPLLPFCLSVGGLSCGLLGYKKYRIIFIIIFIIAVIFNLYFCTRYRAGIA